MSEQEKNSSALEQESNLNNEMKQRREKLDALRSSSPVAFPNDFRRDAISDELHQKYDGKTAQELETERVQVKIAGRMMTRRIMGKASFATLQDMGGRIQIYVTRDSLPEGFYNDTFKKWDLGDILGVEGYVFKTKTGELSIHVEKIRLLTKSLRPLPEKFKGLTDQETRCRQRYLDLIANEESRRTFQIRSRTIQAIRRYLGEHRFMEVETPMMQTIPGGASARPFITHHNALNMDMYLRIAPELYLKRLVVGGFERVFELNRNFRNEGIDVRHNPEFTMIEFYMAYADYRDLITLTEDMFKYIALEVLGTSKFIYAKPGEEGFEIDFSKPFAQMTMKEAILKYAPGVTEEDLNDFERAKAVAKRLHIDVMDSWELGHIYAAIFEETAEEKLIQPTFITEYPAAVSPLARRNDVKKDFTDRFEFFIAGRELGNGFSELNDADDQAERFRAQVAQKEAGDDEAMYYDADYVTALEYGLPPTAGEGIGIDRLVMLLTNSHTIRDVILFPALKNIKADNRTAKCENEAETAVSDNIGMFTPNDKIDFSGVKVEPLFADCVDFETFSKSDFRAVKVKSCEAVPKSKKLLKFVLDDGTDTDRVILSGIHAFYEPENLIGKTLIAITNLPPRAMMGIESRGMLLSAVNERNGEEELRLLMVDNHIPAGAKLY